MPTARPIIIEKFMDHTDSGVTMPNRRKRRESPCDAGHGQDEREPGGDRGAEGHEQQDDRRQRTAARPCGGPPRSRR